MTMYYLTGGNACLWFMCAVVCVRCSMCCVDATGSCGYKSTDQPNTACRYLCSVAVHVLRHTQCEHTIIIAGRWLTFDRARRHWATLTKQRAPPQVSAVFLGFACSFHGMVVATQVFAANYHTALLASQGFDYAST